MAADPQGTDPNEQDPAERNLSRRSETPAVNPWLSMAGIGLLAGIVYVVSALL